MDGIGLMATQKYGSSVHLIKKFIKLKINGVIVTVEFLNVHAMKSFIN